AQRRPRRSIGRKAGPMSQALKTICFTAIVAKNDDGFVARPVELYLPNGYWGSFSGKTQREALNKLKEAAADWLGWRANDGTLADVLDEAGFLATVDSPTLEPRIVSTEDIFLPLPKNWFKKKKGAIERQGSDGLS